PLLIIVFFLTFIGVYAQEAAVHGKIRDADTGKILEFANIVLLNPQDSTLINGGVSDHDGNFEIPAAFGSYLLRAGFLGYDPLVREIEISVASLDVGTLRLSSSASDLQEVTVTGVISMFESD